MREFLGEAGVSKLCRLTKNAIWEAIANSRLDGVTLESIAITSPPDKTRYAPGECFDPTGMAVRALFSNGQTAYIRTENLTFTPSGPLEDGTDCVTVCFQFGKTVAPAQQAIRTAYRIWGVRWDGSATSRWTRTDEAADFEDPVPYVAGGAGFGSPFDGLQPWAGMVKSKRSGGIMVAIPKFWYRLTQEGEGLQIRIADGPAAGFQLSPAHMDRGDGRGERDVVYIGRYHCAQDSWKSETGKLPRTQTRRLEARAAIHTLGEKIWQTDFALRFTLWLLYLVEFADWNSQKTLGLDCGNGTGTEQMGYTDGMPYHTGTVRDSREVYGLGVQYRNIEGLWGNAQDWCDGCYNLSDGMYVILNPEKFDDKANGIKIGQPVADIAYPSGFAVSTAAGFPVFYASRGDGTETAGSCDYWTYHGTYKCLITGGYFDQSGRAGLFNVQCNSAGALGDGVGCRLQELP